MLASGTSQGCHSAPPLRVEAPSAPSKQVGFWLVADSQFEHMTGFGARASSDLADEVSSVAIRPPTLDLFAENVLRSALAEMKATNPRRPIFFLGDAANIACADEYDHFLAVMNEEPWLGVIGNHDSKYMGNFVFAPDRPNGPVTGNKFTGACARAPGERPLRATEMWKRIAAFELRNVWTDGSAGARTDQNTMSKLTVTLAYLSDLRARACRGGGCSAFPDPLEDASWRKQPASEKKKKDDAPKWSFSARGTVGSSRFSIESAIWPGPSGEWLGYLVQDVLLEDGSHALLVDTDDKQHQPPGKTGTLTRLLCTESLFDECGVLGSDQGAELEKIVHGWGPNTTFVVLGHHPSEQIHGSGRKPLDDLRRTPGFVAFFSAHTHDPTAAVWGNNKLAEVNLASITDFPNQFLGVDGWETTPKGSRVQVSLRADWPVDDRWPTLPACTSNGEAEELDYETRPHYLARALAVYADVLVHVPQQELGSVPVSNLTCRSASLQEDIACRRESIKTALGSHAEAPMRAALASMIEFDEDVLRRSEWVRRVEQRCALWASEVEHRKGKLLPSRPLRSTTRLHYEPANLIFEAPSERAE